jgi:hypothetical protein
MQDGQPVVIKHGEWPRIVRYHANILGVLSECFRLAGVITAGYCAEGICDQLVYVLPGTNKYGTYLYFCFVSLLFHHLYSTRHF